MDKKRQIKTRKNLRRAKGKYRSKHFVGRRLRGGSQKELELTKLFTNSSLVNVYKTDETFRRKLDVPSGATKRAEARLALNAINTDKKTTAELETIMKAAEEKKKKAKKKYEAQQRYTRWGAQAATEAARLKWEEWKGREKNAQEAYNFSVAADEADKEFKRYLKAGGTDPSKPYEIFNEYLEYYILLIIIGKLDKEIVDIINYPENKAINVYNILVNYDPSLHKNIFEIEGVNINDENIVIKGIVLLFKYLEKLPAKTSQDIITNFKKYLEVNEASEASEDYFQKLHSNLPTMLIQNASFGIKILAAFSKFLNILPLIVSQFTKDSYEMLFTRLADHKSGLSQAPEINKELYKKTIDDLTSVIKETKLGKKESAKVTQLKKVFTGLQTDATFMSLTELIFSITRNKTNTTHIALNSLGLSAVGQFTMSMSNIDPKNKMGLEIVKGINMLSSNDFNNLELGDDLNIFEYITGLNEDMLEDMRNGELGIVDIFKNIIDKENASVEQSGGGFSERKAKLYSYLDPINKSLWSPSFTQKATWKSINNLLKPVDFPKIGWWARGFLKLISSPFTLVADIFIFAAAMIGARFVSLIVVELIVGGVLNAIYTAMEYIVLGAVGVKSYDTKKQEELKNIAKNPYITFFMNSVRVTDGGHLDVFSYYLTKLNNQMNPSDQGGGAAKNSTEPGSGLEYVINYFKDQTKKIPEGQSKALVYEGYVKYHAAMEIFIIIYEDIFKNYIFNKTIGNVSTNKQANKFYGYLAYHTEYIKLKRDNKDNNRKYLERISWFEESHISMGLIRSNIIRLQKGYFNSGYKEYKNIKIDGLSASKSYDILLERNILEVLKYVFEFEFILLEWARQSAEGPTIRPNTKDIQKMLLFDADRKPQDPENIDCSNYIAMKVASFVEKDKEKVSKILEDDKATNILFLKYIIDLFTSNVGGSTGRNNNYYVLASLGPKKIEAISKHINSNHPTLNLVTVGFGGEQSSKVSSDSLFGQKVNCKIILDEFKEHNEYKSSQAKFIQIKNIDDNYKNLRSNLDMSQFLAQLLDFLNKIALNIDITNGATGIEMFNTNTGATFLALSREAEADAENIKLKSNADANAENKAKKNRKIQLLHQANGLKIIGNVKTAINKVFSDENKEVIKIKKKKEQSIGYSVSKNNSAQKIMSAEVGTAVIAGLASAFSGGGKMGMSGGFRKEGGKTGMLSRNNNYVIVDAVRGVLEKMNPSTINDIMSFPIKTKPTKTPWFWDSFEKKINERLKSQLTLLQLITKPINYNPLDPPTDSDEPIKLGEQMFSTYQFPKNLNTPQIPSDLEHPGIPLACLLAPNIIKRDSRDNPKSIDTNVFETMKGKTASPPFDEKAEQIVQNIGLFLKKYIEYKSGKTKNTHTLYDINSKFMTKYSVEQNRTEAAALNIMTAEAAAAAAAKEQELTDANAQLVEARGDHQRLVEEYNTTKATAAALEGELTGTLFTGAGVVLTGGVDEQYTEVQTQLNSLFGELGFDNNFLTFPELDPIVPMAGGGTIQFGGADTNELDTLKADIQNVTDKINKQTQKNKALRRRYEQLQTIKALFVDDNIQKFANYKKEFIKITTALQASAINPSNTDNSLTILLIALMAKKGSSEQLLSFEELCHALFFANNDNTLKKYTDTTSLPVNKLLLYNLNNTWKKLPNNQPLSAKDPAECISYMNNVFESLKTTMETLKTPESLFPNTNNQLVETLIKHCTNNKNTFILEYLQTKLNNNKTSLETIIETYLGVNPAEHGDTKVTKIRETLGLKRDIEQISEKLSVVAALEAPKPDITKETYDDYQVEEYNAAKVALNEYIKQIFIGQDTKLLKIYATGDWRKGREKHEMYAQLQNNFGDDIELLSQEAEAINSAKCAHNILKDAGHNFNTNDLTLYVEAGRGSTQFSVLDAEGNVAAKALADDGFPTEGPVPYEKKQAAVKKIIQAVGKPDKITLIVAYGSLWYLLEKAGTPVVPDNDIIPNPISTKGLNFPMKFLTDITDFNETKMIVIRNVNVNVNSTTTDSKNIRKVTWAGGFNDDSIIDLGSGKVAVVKTKTGVQSYNTNLPTTPAEIITLLEELRTAGAYPNSFGKIYQQIRYIKKFDNNVAKLNQKRTQLHPLGNEEISGDDGPIKEALTKEEAEVRTNPELVKLLREETESIDWTKYEKKAPPKTESVSGVELEQELTKLNNYFGIKYGNTNFEAGSTSIKKQILLSSKYKEYTLKSIYDLLKTELKSVENAYRILATGTNTKYTKYIDLIIEGKKLKNLPSNFSVREEDKASWRIYKELYNIFTQVKYVILDRVDTILIVNAFIELVNSEAVYLCNKSNKLGTLLPAKMPVGPGPALGRTPFLFLTRPEGNFKNVYMTKIGQKFQINYNGKVDDPDGATTKTKIDSLIVETLKNKIGIYDLNLNSSDDKTFIQLFDTFCYYNRNELSISKAEANTKTLQQQVNTIKLWNDFAEYNEPWKDNVGAQKTIIERSNEYKRIIELFDKPPTIKDFFNFGEDEADKDEKRHIHLKRLLTQNYVDRNNEVINTMDQEDDISTWDKSPDKWKQTFHTNLVTAVQQLKSTYEEDSTWEPFLKTTCGLSIDEIPNPSSIPPQQTTTQLQLLIKLGNNPIFNTAELWTTIRKNINSKKTMAQCTPKQHNNEIVYSYKDSFGLLIDKKSNRDSSGKLITTDPNTNNLNNIVAKFETMLVNDNIERIVLFVFGITGSGKDTFLNHIYGSMANKPIHDDDDGGDVNHVNTWTTNLVNALGEGSSILRELTQGGTTRTLNCTGYKETCYYINCETLEAAGDNFMEKKQFKAGQFIQKEGSAENATETESVPDYNTFIETTKKWMRQGTPFNPQSTRGFNIREFQAKVAANDTDTKKHIIIINVPGFEPPHGVATYSFIDPTNIVPTGQNPSTILGTTPVQISKPFLFKPVFVDNLKLMLVDGYKGASPKSTLSRASTISKKERSEIIGTVDELYNYVLFKDIIMQGMFIVITLNYMSIMLKQYIDIRDNKKTAEKCFEEGFSSYNIDNQWDSSAMKDLDFPTNKLFDILNPFEKDDNKKYYKYEVNATNGNFEFYKTINDNYTNVNSGNFIYDLNKILFDKGVGATARINANVVRPLRGDGGEGGDEPIMTALIDHQQALNSIKNMDPTSPNPPKPPKPPKAPNRVIGSKDFRGDFELKSNKVTFNGNYPFFYYDGCLTRRHKIAQNRNVPIEKEDMSEIPEIQMNMVKGKEMLDRRAMKIFMKKLVIDSTLFSTLKGFCEISGGDT